MRIHALVTLGLLACTSLVTACSSNSVSYSDPTTPTGSQMQAVTSLTDVGSHVSVALKGMSDADKAFGVHSLMATLQSTAVKQSGTSQGLSLDVQGIDAACTTGTPATGFTYTNCMLDGGQGTINGTIKITATSVTYDLKVSVSSSGTSTDLILTGTISNTAGRLTGNLEYKFHIDISGVVASVASAAAARRTPPRRRTGTSRTPIPRRASPAASSRSRSTTPAGSMARSSSSRAATPSWSRTARRV